MVTIYKSTKVCATELSLLVSLRELKVPQVRTITRYGTGSIILFNYAESPIETFSIGDYSLRFVKEFRINELTSNVPYAVRSVLRTL